MIRVWADYSSEELKDVKNVIVPIGAIEQHGRHLPVGTDMYLIEGLVEKLIGHDLSEDFYILPVLPIGKSSEHMSYTGTITLSSHTLLSLLWDIAKSLSSHGVDRIVFLSGHGGNNGIIDSLLYDIRSSLNMEAYAFHLGLMFASADRNKCVLPYSMHAGYAETSAMKYMYPERFSALYGKEPSKCSSSKGFDFLLSMTDGNWGWCTEDISSSGYIGDPSESSFADGEKIIEKVVQIFICGLEKIIQKGGKNE